MITIHLLTNGAYLYCGAPWKDLDALTSYITNYWSAEIEIIKAPALLNAHWVEKMQKDEDDRLRERMHTAYRESNMGGLDEI